MTDAVAEKPNLMQLQIAAIVDEVHNFLGQGELFERTGLKADFVKRFKEQNPDRFVLPTEFLAKTRYQAAILGAGFDRSYGPSLTAHNRMWDEVANMNFAHHVMPSIAYDFTIGHYALTEVELTQLLEFDYDNLEACRASGFDLLYETED